MRNLKNGRSDSRGRRITKNSDELSGSYDRRNYKRGTKKNDNFEEKSFGRGRTSYGKSSRSKDTEEKRRGLNREKNTYAKTSNRGERKPVSDKRLDSNMQDTGDFKVEGRNAVIELLKSGKPINKIFFQKGEKQGSINEIIKLAKKNNLLTSEVEKAKLDMLSDTGHHQGVIAFISATEYKTIDDIFALAEERNEDPFILIADEIEDPHNLGALIRTAECAGCHGVIIPKRRAVGVTEVVAKTSVGAIEYVPIVRVNNINETIKDLQKRNVWIVGTDGKADKLYYEQDLTGSIAIVIGSEGKGMSDLTMKNCDFLVKIPMMGKITSLNASVSGGVVVFEALRQRLSK